MKQELLSPRYRFSQEDPYIPSVSKAQLDLIEVVKSKLENGDYKLRHNSCPCGSKNQDVIISEIDRYGLCIKSVLCMDCGSVRMNPYLDDISLQDFYSSVYRKMYGIDIISNSYEEYFQKQRSYAQQILEASQNFLQPNDWVCEVGCGSGGGLKVFMEKGYNVAGCDYDIDAIRFGKEKGVDNLFHGSLSDLSRSLAGVKFNLLFLHHVFEHLSDPLSFLKTCKTALSNNGKLVLVVPDITRIDQTGNPACLGNLLMYLHIAHKYNFSFEGIKRLAFYAGYSVAKLDSKFEKHQKNLPELWLVLTPDNHPDSNFSQNAGVNLLRYLKNTERLFSLGLCRGQLENKFRKILSLGAK